MDQHICTPIFHETPPNRETRDEHARACGGRWLRMWHADLGGGEVMGLIEADELLTVPTAKGAISRRVRHVSVCIYRPPARDASRRPNRQETAAALEFLELSHRRKEAQLARYDHEPHVMHFHWSV